MTFIQQYNKLASIAYDIQLRETGSLKKFAQKCGLSKRTLSNQIDILRQFAALNDAKILYSRKKNTYYFSPLGKFTDFAFKEFT